MDNIGLLLDDLENQIGDENISTRVREEYINLFITNSNIEYPEFYKSLFIRVLIDGEILSNNTSLILPNGSIITFDIFKTYMESYHKYLTEMIRDNKIDKVLYG